MTDHPDLQEAEEKVLDETLNFLPDLECHPSVIAGRVGIGERYILLIWKSLEKKGLLKVIKRHHNGTVELEMTNDLLSVVAKAIQVKEPEESRYQRQMRFINAFDAAWSDWKLDDDSEVPRDKYWKGSLVKFFEKGLSQEAVEELVTTAMTKRGLHYKDVWRYFCGCCWTMIKAENFS